MCIMRTEVLVAVIVCAIYTQVVEACRGASLLCKYHKLYLTI